MYVVLATRPEPSIGIFQYGGFTFVQGLHVV